MPTPFERQTLSLQFMRVESELATLKAMVRDLFVQPMDPAQFAPNAPLTVEQPPTEAPEPRAQLAGKPVHFDGHHWRQGPSPEPSDADKPVGQG